MSDNPGPRKRQTFYWIWCVAIVGLAAGIWAAATPAIAPLAKPSMGALMILAGLLLMSPWSTSRPIDEPQRKARLRLSVVGAASVLNGVGQLVPNPNVTFAFMVLNVLLMGAVITGLPKRVFAVRP